MRRATRVVAAWFGIIAGLAGIEHGVFEILWGNGRPDTLFINSMGLPCDPETVWHVCEPAFTVLPNYLVTGILAVLIALLTIIWSAVFVHKKYGGIILILLSIVSFLFGGGIFPPVIGLIGGAAGTKINKPLPEKQPGTILHFAAWLWPWPLVVFAAWLLGQWVVWASLKTICVRRRPGKREFKFWLRLWFRTTLRYGLVIGRFCQSCLLCRGTPRWGSRGCFDQFWRLCRDALLAGA